MIVSVTHLELNSWWYLFHFMRHSTRSLKQARRAQGNLHASVRKTQGRSFWTLSAWESKQAMRQYMLSGDHKKAMPLLRKWCDKASTTHWEEETLVFTPDWTLAEQKLAEAFAK